MNKYIDHEAAINAALLAKSDADITLVPGSFTNGFIEGAKIKENAILNALADVPAADVVEARHGRWIRTDGIAHGIVSRVCSCSLCKRNAGVSENGFWYLSDYCPNCGAKMTEDHHEQKE